MKNESFGTIQTGDGVCFGLMTGGYFGVVTGGDGCKGVITTGSD